MLIIVAAVLGALGAAGVGAVVAGLTGAAVGAVGGAIASIAHMVILTRQARTPGALTWPAVLAAVFCGLVAGIFYAFSSAVMQSLAMQPGVAGMAVMQTINVVVFNPWFGFAFSATPGFCVMAMNAALVHRREPASTYALGGGALFLVGTLGVTVFGNVPRNDALAAASTMTSDGLAVWATYLNEWTFWNSVRTAAALAAAVLFTVGLAKRT
jgi:uncharacterized membrane protein